MRFRPRRAACVAAAVLALILVQSPEAVAQARRFGVLGFGAFSRVGSVPAAFEPGMPIAIEATVQWPIAGALQLATSADLTVQRMGTALSIATLFPGSATSVIRKPYAFDVVHVSAGPAFVMPLTARASLSGSLQASMLVPSWGSASVGVCGEGCSVLEPAELSQQTELHMGTVGRVRLTYGQRKERIGVELMGIAGGRHSRSRLPLSSIALMIVVGAS